MSVAAIIRRLPEPAVERGQRRREEHEADRRHDGRVGDAERHEPRANERDDERRCDRERRERGNGRQLISGSRATPRQQGAREQRHARAVEDERRDDADDSRVRTRDDSCGTPDYRDRERGRAGAREGE